MCRRTLSVSLLAVVLTTTLLLGACKKKEADPDIAEPQAPGDTGALTLPQPAEPPRTLTGKQLTVKPVAGRLSRLCSFSMWQ